MSTLIEDAADLRRRELEVRVAKAMADDMGHGDPVRCMAYARAAVRVLGESQSLANADGAVANANGLLPCPFCGDDGCSVAVMQEGASGDDYSFSAEAQCMCGATGPEAYGACASDAALIAINAWSRRAHPASSADRVAELEAQLAESREREGRWRNIAIAGLNLPYEQEKAQIDAALAADKEKK